MFHGFALCRHTRRAAIHVNGARFNDAIGDTVNRDLIPPMTIETVNLEAPNPVCGVDALGGLPERWTKGRVFHPDRAYNGLRRLPRPRGCDSGYGGQQAGSAAVFVAADVAHGSGFRRSSTSDLDRLYSELGWGGDAAELHLSMTAARDKLAAPDQFRRCLQTSPISSLRRTSARHDTSRLVIEK